MCVLHLMCASSTWRAPGRRKKEPQQPWRARDDDGATGGVGEEMVSIQGPRTSHDVELLQRGVRCVFAPRRVPVCALEELRQSQKTLLRPHYLLQK